MPSNPTTTRRFLCISYAFPPINRSGTFRTLGFIKHLAQLGWSASVITSVEKNEPIDSQLLTGIPHGTDIHRVKWDDRVAELKRTLGIRHHSHRKDQLRSISPSSAENSHLPLSRFRIVTDWATGLLHLPDSRSGWIKPAIRSAAQIIENRPIDLIYSTSPYASAHIIAMKLKRMTNLRWVADFRDPWCGNPFTRKKFLLHHYIEANMEKRVLQLADGIVANTPKAREQLCIRYPQIQNKCVTILNGFDADMIDNIVPLRTVSPETFSIVHCGQFYGPRSPIGLLKAIRTLTQRHPRFATGLKLTLVGNAKYDGQSIMNLAQELGVASQVDIVGEKSHAESLNYMAGSDALALVGSNGPDSDLQIPNKLFEYIAMKKPVLAVFTNNHPAIDILQRSKSTFTRCRPDHVEEITSALDCLIHKGTSETRYVSNTASLYNRTQRAEELAEMFNDLITNNTNDQGRVLHHAAATVAQKATYHRTVTEPTATHTPHA